MESIQLTHEEIRVILSICNAFFRAGGITLGDALMVAPLALKLESLLPPGQTPPGTSGNPAN